MKAFIATNEKLISTGLLILRIALGGILFAHGAQKVLGIFGGKGLDATITGMSDKFGSVLPYLSVFTEFLGGLFILLGLFTRFFGIAALINMLVAVFAVHISNGFFAPKGFEFPASLAMMALAITVAGPGLFSLDWTLFGRTEPRATMAGSHTSSTFAVPAGTAHFRPAK